MLMPETILQNRYRIVRQLGQGGMGTVYEAVDGRLDTMVAVKETHAADERLLKQFEREAQLLARLQHPALPRVSDHFTEGDGQFLIMQFIAGADLGELIENRGAGFPVSEVLRWGDELLDALDYLHTQNPPVIHRDIKPQNLKLSERGRVILLDFGLAKGLPPGQSPQQPTTSKSILGYTPNYAPLEQIHGEGTDAKSDLYSLGATLYHLLTGTVPPGSLKRVTALSNGEADPLVPAHRLNSRVPAKVSIVLNLALAIARNHRPADAAEMRRALHVAKTDLRPDDDDAAGGEAHTVLLSTRITEPSPSDAATQLSDSTSVPELASLEAVALAKHPPATLTNSQPTFNQLLLITGLTVLLISAAIVAYKFSGVRQQPAGAGETTATTASAADQSGAAAQSTIPAQSELERKAAAGQQLFQSLDCIKCHGNKGEGKIGPALTGLLGEEVRLSNEVTTIADESYIRESILVPNARVVAGYKPIMPAFRSQLSDEQVAQLVAYIVWLNEKNVSAR
ncbi:MAG: protein kinase [Pyrinomonadaceae bacterium]|nr:protein kinase [Pyrinomonadaceae bacterium]